MMRAGIVLVTLMTSLVALAGCAGGNDNDGADVVDPDDFVLQVGRGAIAGLLVDDRFRPIHLTDTPRTEFQAEGFILLQETGEQVQTNEDGEFTFVDLEPGEYTLRIQAGGHEATPRTLQVNQGEFTEQTVIARRIAGQQSTIVVQEYAIFIPCAAYAVTDCTFDRSGDSGRYSTGWDNLTEFLPEMEYVKVEAKMNQPGIYCLEVRYPQLGGATDEPSYADWCVGEGEDYISGILQVDENYEQDGKDPFNATGPSDVILFYFGNNELTCWNEYPIPPTQTDSKRCAGVGLGIEAKLAISIFVGPPEVDLESYRLFPED